MAPLAIVPGEPSGQVGGAASRRRERDGVGPFTQQGLEETLGLAVGFRRVGPGADVPDAQHPERLGEQLGGVGGPLSVITRSTRMPRAQKQRRARMRKPVIDPRRSSGSTST